MTDLGSVITFYSYKGGVGRSFTLANAAVILASWGYRVLVVDWDIEAPGLDHYFQRYSRAESAGVVEFLQDCRKREVKSWRHYCRKLQIPSVHGAVYLMPAAREKTNYQRTVQRLKWDQLFARHQLGEQLESLRNQWTKEFDFILLDSRTGITDFSGITTALLPDALFFLFTANHQSLDGCIDVVRRAAKARDALSIDRAALRAVPIPSKFELREEYERGLEWRRRFSQATKKLMNDWVPPETEHSKILDLLSVPYIPRWTFGEELAVLEERADRSRIRSPSFPVSYAIETIAALIASKFSRVDLLYSNRDEFVFTAITNAAEATKQGRRDNSVYISYAPENAVLRDVIEECLRLNDFNVETLARDARPIGRIFSDLTNVIQDANALIVIVGKELTAQQDAEVEAYLKHSMRWRRGRRPVIPLVLPEGEDAFRQSYLGDYQAIFFDPEIEVLRQIGPVLSRLREASVLRRY